jgi:hypothetical protein
MGYSHVQKLLYGIRQDGAKRKEGIMREGLTVGTTCLQYDAI